jgi:L-ascorbate metabolism protein UlaG (beta-lactamase superfamily)
MKKLLVLVAVLLVVLATAGAWLGWQLRSRPSVERYAGLTLEEADDDGLRVTFLGVSTLLFRDKTASVLIDGFFTRPGLARTALGKITPDPVRIAAGLQLAGIEHLDAVVTAHSHYDHAMDSAEVAARTGAVVVGSMSTANIARGRGLAEGRIHVVTGTETMRFGDLRVTLVPSQHFPHGRAMGEITAPLVPPARATDYLEGGSFSILVERKGQAVLVQASAGFLKDALVGRKADVVFLGVGLLGSKDEAYRDAYWRETVGAVGARRVIPIHWDDFTRGLDEPLVPLPYLLDDLDASMSFVLARAAFEHIDVRWPVVGVKIDPFAQAETGIGGE